MLKVDRKKSIVDAAEEIFAQKGYYSASIADIIEKAGIARGTFYLYFDNKKSIFDSLLDNLLDVASQAIKRIELDDSAPSIIDQLKGNLNRTFSILLEKKNLTKILLSYSSGIDKEFDRKVSDFYFKVLGLIESAITLGIEMQIIKFCHPNVIASCILGIIKEVAFALIFAHYTIEDIDKLSDEIIQFALHGLLINDLEYKSFSGEKHGNFK